jgi:hypothetical protein
MSSTLPPTTTLDSIITSHLNRLLESRAYPKTICPSEVARALSTTDLSQAGFTSWREAMNQVRAAAWVRDDIEVLQHGTVISKDAEIKGPIRLRLQAQ